MNRAWIAALLAVVMVSAGGGVATAGRTAAVQPDRVSIVVTSVSDGAVGVCPSDSACTLRRAIETANGDISGADLVITFDHEVFPAATPSSIVVGTSALPVVTRAHVTIDGSSAGVIIAGNSQDLSGDVNGLVFTGADSVVRGLSIRHFSGACLSVSGDHAQVGGNADLAQGNYLGDCGIGVAASGSNANIAGNHVGFAPGSTSAAHAAVGILVTGSNGTVGDEAAGSGSNVIGNTGTAIRIGGGGPDPTNGNRVLHNVIGQATGVPAPVDIGVDLRQPASGTVVVANAISFATTGIAVASDSQGNQLGQNTFASIAALAIDLNADGFTNANDDGDGDIGANGLINHPVLSRTVQSRIEGSARAACANCAVQLYLAAHSAGSPNDYGTVPVPGATTTTDADGLFAFENAAVMPGQWVTALVTDPAGNTSEFGPSARVGSGIVQCGNVTLTPGWNHVGFFGPEPLTLGSTFPTADSVASPVSAIYHLRDGTATFDHWFSHNEPGRTLDTLLPGEAYWFYAEDPVLLSAGFSLSVPLPLQLKAGWNDIVYIGAPADVRDALASVQGRYRDVYEWTADEAGGHWAAWGDANAPSWARDFTDLRACGTYELFVTEDSLLLPLQP